jgi:hypothetical protein
MVTATNGIVYTAKRNGRQPMSTTPNSPPSDLQPVTAPKIRKSRKHPTIQTAVIAKALTGENKTNIAKDLKITRGTVNAILNQTDIAHQIELGRSRAISLIPRSLDVVENRLEKNDGSVAISLLRGTQVLVNQQNTTIQNNTQANVWIQMRERATAEKAITVEATTTASGSSEK